MPGGAAASGSKNEVKPKHVISYPQVTKESYGIEKALKD